MEYFTERKLVANICKKHHLRAVHTYCKQHVEEAEEFTARKVIAMNRSSKKAVAFSEEQLDEVTELLCRKTGVIDKLREEVGIDSIEDEMED